MNLGERIKLAREQKGLSRYSLSVEVGERECNIIAWETSKRTPRVPALLAIANALSTTIDDLVRGE